MNILILQHAPFEGPGAITAWMQARGHTFTSIPLYAQAPLPDHATYDVVIVMGGPMNIYQYRDYPWLAAEHKFLSEAVTLGKKLIGICLGAQLLADVLGARVRQNAEVEIGWYPIQFSTEAQSRLGPVPETVPVLHWHGDTFTLPCDATRLATSAGCGEQGFIYKDQVLALQFHLEITPEILEDLLQACANELVPGRYVQNAEVLRTGLKTEGAVAQDLLFHLFDKFLNEKP